MNILKKLEIKNQENSFHLFKSPLFNSFKLSSKNKSRDKYDQFSPKNLKIQEIMEIMQKEKLMEGIYRLYLPLILLPLTGKTMEWWHQFGTKVVVGPVMPFLQLVQ